MKCQAIFRLLSAERDRVLSPEERTHLEAHVTECAECRQARRTVPAAIGRWQATTSAATTPDVERAWQDIRREIRVTSSAKSSSSLRVLRWAIPAGAAAALAILATVVPRSSTSKVEAAQVAQVAQRDTARADFVEVPNNASSMVYVDDQSGWLVVWSVADAQPAGG